MRGKETEAESCPEYRGNMAGKVGGDVPVGLPRPTGHVSGHETHSRLLRKPCLWKAGLVWREGLGKGTPRGALLGAGAGLVADLLAALAALYS